MSLTLHLEAKWSGTKLFRLALAVSMISLVT